MEDRNEATSAVKGMVDAYVETITILVDENLQSDAYGSVDGKCLSRTQSRASRASLIP